MPLSYELARRHYQIRRILELEPGSRAFERIASCLRDLPAEAMVLLLEHDPKAYKDLIPLCLLCQHFRGLSPERLNTEILSSALNELFSEFSLHLIQELERLIHDDKLSRYPFAKTLLLQEIRFHQSYATQSPVIPLDRDRFRQYLSGYVYLVRAGFGNPYLIEIWNETAWFRRWQIDSTPARQLLPVQNSLRGQIVKYKLSEPARRLYADLDQGMAQPDVFLAQLAPVIQNYLKECPAQLNSPFEGRVRDVIQVVMRHAMKKGYRVESLSQEVLKSIHFASQAPHGEASGFVVYTTLQELILATQNLKYRLNDALNGVTRALAELSSTPYAEQRWYWGQQALLDGVMEIYESFNLADTSLKAFVDHYQQACTELRYANYQQLSGDLQTLFSAS